MAKRTLDTLAHILAEARRREGLPDRKRPPRRVDEPECVLRCFTDGVRARTGREIADLLHPGEAWTQVAERLQSIAPTRPTHERVVFRETENPSRRVVLLPGLYGIVEALGGLAQLLPEDRDVVGWNWAVAEHPEDVLDSIESFASVIAQEEIARDRGRPLEIFGYCIGGTIGQELGVQLLRAGVDVRRVVALDAHPGMVARTVSYRSRLMVGAPAVVRAAKKVGPLEHGLVQTALAQLKALPRHRPSRLETDFILLRSGSRLGLGELEPDTWAGLARAVEFHRLGDLGHVEVFRGGHEERLVPYCLAS